MFFLRIEDETSCGGDCRFRSDSHLNFRMLLNPHSLEPIQKLIKMALIFRDYNVVLVIYEGCQGYNYLVPDQYLLWFE